MVRVTNTYLYSGLFRKTTERNKELETRVATLERELTVWKLAFASYEEEKEALQKKVTRLKRSIGSLKVTEQIL